MELAGNRLRRRRAADHGESSIRAMGFLPLAVVSTVVVSVSPNGTGVGRKKAMKAAAAVVDGGQT